MKNMFERQATSMSEARKRHEIEKEELVEKHNEEKTQVETTFKKQEEKRKLALLKFKKNVEDLTNEMEKLEVGPQAGSGSENITDDGVEEAKGHLECPVCFEKMRPPTRIWQCPQSHLVCETCRDQLENLRCPSCRTETVSQRARAVENMAEALFGK